jgi:pyruvate/2-oxoglutarate dehydrogenase complex dihydrolipoamide acyltransferase (E2) component
VLDDGILGSNRHIMNGLIEADVTRAQEIRPNQEIKVSFTAFLAACWAGTVAKHPHVKAYYYSGDISKCEALHFCVHISFSRVAQSTK